MVTMKPLAVMLKLFFGNVCFHAVSCFNTIDGNIIKATILMKAKPPVPDEIHATFESHGKDLAVLPRLA